MMSDHARGRAGRGSLFWRMYMFGWALLAGGALTYLSIFVLDGNGFGRVTAKPPQGEQESNRAELDRAQLAAQVRSLNETIASLRTDLARIKDRPESMVTVAREPLESGGDSQGQVAVVTAPASQPTPPEPAPLQPSIDGTSTITTASIGQPAETAPATAPQAAAISPPVQPRPSDAASAPAIVAPATRPQAKGRNRATYLLRADQVPPIPTSLNRPQAGLAPLQPNSRNPGQPVVLNRALPQVPDQTRDIRTGSLPQAAPPTRPGTSTPTEAADGLQARSLLFGQPRVVPRTIAAPAAAVSLSTASSITGLRASWLLLTSNQPEAFAGLTPRYVADPTSGTYRLLAGPIVNHAEADRVCNQLRIRGITCGIADYTGSPL